MNLKKAFDAISTQECLGYSPASSSTKPAHVANGWFRRLIGKAYDPVLLNNTIIQWVGSKEENPSEALLQNNADVFAPFLPQNKRQQFVDFRADLRALLSPYGGAANRGNNWSSYNITHREHLTRDRADNSVGAFLHHLLVTDCGAGPSPFGDLISGILNDPSDEISTVTLPLTKQAGESIVSVASYPAPNVFRRARNEFASPVLRQIRRGFDQLSAYESNGGGGLEALRRAVSFGVFAVLLHMVNRARELRKEKGLTPMLLYFQGRRRNTVYYGSHQTYTMCRQAIEFMYIEKFRERIVHRIGENATSKQCQKFVKELEFTRPSDAPGKRDEILNLFSAYSNTQKPVDALASAIKDVTFRMMSGDPTDFFRGMGVRVGLLRPTGGTRKYFTLDGVLLEAVLASIVSRDAMPYRDFLNLLYERYGLLTGGRPEDADVLLKAGIDQVTVEDLRENSLSLRQHLVAMAFSGISVRTI